MVSWELEVTDFAARLVTTDLLALAPGAAGIRKLLTAFLHVLSLLKSTQPRADKMAQQIKARAAKPNEPSSNLRAHVVGENKDFHI